MNKTLKNEKVSNEAKFIEKVEYLHKMFGIKKKFIAEKIGCNQVTLSYILNDKNAERKVVSQDKLKHYLVMLNFHFKI